MTAQDQQLDGRQKHRLTVDEFLLLDRERAFGGRSTELFDGEVYYMSPKHRPHARAIGDLYFAIRNALEASGSKLTAVVDVSVRLSDHDCPEPDIVLTSEPDGEGILPVESAKLVIEVSDSTLAFDLGLKAALYARAGVPEYWVVDVSGKRVHQMWEPHNGTYAQRRETSLSGSIEAMTVPQLAIRG